MWRPAISLVVLLACHGASAETAVRQQQSGVAVPRTPGTPSPAGGGIDAGRDPAAAQVEIPDVRYRQLDDGLRALERWKDEQPFTLEIALVPPELPPGADRNQIRILTQEPLGTVPSPTGEPRARTRRATNGLRVELGLGAEVPDLRDTSLEEARALLQRRALTPVPEPRDSGDDWRVVRQSPASGSVPLSSAVRLGVEPPAPTGPSRPEPREPGETAPVPEPRPTPAPPAPRQPPSLVNVPDLVGRTVREARAEAKAAGLVLVAPRAPGGDVTAKIATQRPAARSLVAAGSTVKVTLFPPPPRFVPPSLVVASAAMIAVLGLALRGLRVRTRRKRVREHVQFRPAPAPTRPKATGARPSGSIPTLTLSPHGDPGAQTLHEAGPS